jgi:Fe2+ transport system protein FeoA
MTESMTMLCELSPGESARVQKVQGKGAVRRRLLDMGLVPGTEIAVVKAAPLGDPVEYLVRGYRLLLRKSEAKLVAVTL